MTNAPAESDQERARRRRLRTTFDGAAQLYDATRPGYPDDVIDFLVATAGLRTGRKVLEVGCGTGQLTERLAHRGYDLTALDLGPSMVAAARSRVGDPCVAFEVAAFEDFDGADGSFDLIVSGAAFHWIDPEVKFRKPAQLLRSGGWLALLGTGERYDDPFGAELHRMWLERSNDDGAWAKGPAIDDTEAIRLTGLYAEPIRRIDERRVVQRAEIVVGVENTRATSLSWPTDVRQQFTEELRQLLGPATEVELTQQTTLTMASVRAGAGR